MSQLFGIRSIGALIGLAFSFVVVWALGHGVANVLPVLSEHGQFTEPTAEHEFHKHPNDYEFSFEGPLGNWDVAQLQRGYKVYKEVCSACHSLKFVAFRNLEELGYSEDQVKAEAATWMVPGIDPKTGEATMVAGKPTDGFPSPYPNEVAAAAANNNAVPPDLSLITQARHDGTNYVASLLTGYQEPSAALREEFPDSIPGPGLYHNPYFANLNLAMPPPLTTPGQVTFDDGTKATIEQMAIDVAAFLTWTAEPNMVKRKQTGWWFLIFLTFATVLAYLSKKQIWAASKPKKAGQAGED